MQEVIREILLYDISLVARANDEVINPVGRVNFKQVPENGTAPNFNHWLRLEVGFLRDPGAKTTSEDYGFHVFEVVARPDGTDRMLLNFVEF